MPTICFGQQPNGFFPKNFFVAKILTARKLQKKLGGEIVLFYHDSDADYRETITVLKDKATGAEVRLNFLQENKIQKKHSPLYLKRIPAGWKEEILKQLPRFIHPSLTPPLKGGEPEAAPSPERGEGQGRGLIEIFKSVTANTVADFCLDMYKKLGLLDGIKIVRSSDPDFRNKAIEILSSRPEWRDPLTFDIQNISDSLPVRQAGSARPARHRLAPQATAGGMHSLGMTGDWYADVEFNGEIVRAQFLDATRLSLHEGGGVYTYLPKPDKIIKAQITPGADERFDWMNSVIKCTHYIYGEGEKDYLKFSDFPDVKFIQRDAVDNPHLAWISALNS